MGNYATNADISYFAQEFDALDSNGQVIIAAAASRLFDRSCEVEDNFFDAATGEYDKVFFGDGSAYLKLPPYVGVLGADPIVILDSDDEEMTIPAYYEQGGYLVIKDEGLRYRYPVTDSFKGWPVNQEITVSANWGFEAIPSDVRMATAQLAVHQWRTGDPAFTAISQAGVPNQAPGIPNQVQVVIDRYRAMYSQKAMFA